MTARKRDPRGTRERVRESALSLFREKGFEKATMRQIAGAAGLSLGAAYHHFPSKEAIVWDHYREQQELHAEQARARLAEAEGLEERLRAVFESHLELRGEDRDLLAVLARSAVTPGDPLSPFAEETRATREASIALLREALEPEGWPEEAEAMIVLGLWALELGLLLYLVHDPSPDQARSWALLDRAMGALPPLLGLLASAPAGPLRFALREALVEAELLSATPEEAPTQEGGRGEGSAQRYGQR